MRLWLVEVLDSRSICCGGTDGFVIRAETEADARRLASELTTDVRNFDMWLDAEAVGCRPIEAEGDPGVLIERVQPG